MNAPRILAAAAALGLLIGAQASAATDYAPLLRAKKFTDAEKLANTRLAQDPGNPEALHAKVEALLVYGASRIEEAVKLGEQCVATHPQQAICHVALGDALGTKAINAGIMSAMGYAGTIRDAFKKAVELDPRNLNARFSLLEYYLQAPGIVGGGKGKAQTLAAQTAALHPEAAKLMLAQIDMMDDQYAKAEAALLAIQPGNDEVAADRQRDLLTGLGQAYMRDKKYADSERIFNTVKKRFPDSEMGWYGLGRLQQEQGRHRDAIAAYEQAAAVIDTAAIHYRIGQAALALGDRQRATAEFGKSLTLKTGLHAKLQADAQAQLKALRG